MKIKLIALLVLVVSAGSAAAIVDISAGPYIGMDIPIVNDRAGSGTLFGVQAKATLMSFLGVGVHFNSSSLGDIDHTFFEEDQDDQFSESLPGGDVKSFGVDAYLGLMGVVPKVKVYLMGSIGTWKWERDYTDSVSEVVYGIGPGVEVVLPMGLGIEGRGMLRVAPTDGGGSIKSFLWFVGANYHFFSRLK